MPNEIRILLVTAASIGFLHTILGPDHYLPFIVMAKAREWTTGKTARVTFLCGLGHVLSSVVLGFAGVLLGIEVFKLESIEAARGDWAAWLLLAFGFTYMVWGVHRALRNRPHSHTHADEDDHRHDHGKKLTPWVLFTIFVFGPCEPLIPILMYPAATSAGLGYTALVAGVFSIVTIGTMMSLVLSASLGLKILPMRGLQRYSHAIAGFAVLLCGGAIKFLGL